MNTKKTFCKRSTTQEILACQRAGFIAYVRYIVGDPDWATQMNQKHYLFKLEDKLQDVYDWLKDYKIDSTQDPISQVLDIFLFEYEQLFRTEECVHLFTSYFHQAVEEIKQREKTFRQPEILLKNIQPRTKNQNNFYRKMRKLKSFRRFHNEPSTLLSGIQWGIRKRIKEYENYLPVVYKEKGTNA